MAAADNNTARFIPSRLTHGHSINRTPSSTYRSWQMMKNRCQNSTAENWKWYGARGITICKRWEKFENFLSDMGEKPKGKSLDRINNAIGYSPENCKWSSIKEQCRNRRSNRLIDLGGEIVCITEAAERLGIKKSTLSFRLNHGWSIQDAISRPVRSR